MLKQPHWPCIWHSARTAPHIDSSSTTGRSCSVSHLAMRNWDSRSVRNLYSSVTHPLSFITWKPNLHLSPYFYGMMRSKLQTSEFQRNFWQHNLFMWWRLSVSSILIGCVWQPQKSSCDLPDGFLFSSWTGNPGGPIPSCRIPPPLPCGFSPRHRSPWPPQTEATLLQ